LLPIHKFASLSNLFRSLLTSREHQRLAFLLADVANTVPLHKAVLGITAFAAAARPGFNRISP